jgi:hypothetical protein
MSVEVDFWVILLYIFPNYLHIIFKGIVYLVKYPFLGQKWHNAQKYRSKNPILYHFQLKLEHWTRPSVKTPFFIISIPTDMSLTFGLEGQVNTEPYRFANLNNNIQRHCEQLPTFGTWHTFWTKCCLWPLTFAMTLKVMSPLYSLCLNDLKFRLPHSWNFHKFFRNLYEKNRKRICFAPNDSKWLKKKLSPHASYIIWNGCSCVSYEICSLIIL